jgi:hypothetical protein
MNRESKSGKEGRLCGWTRSLFAAVFGSFEGGSDMRGIAKGDENDACLI